MWVRDGTPMSAMNRWNTEARQARPGKCSQITQIAVTAIRSECRGIVRMAIDVGRAHFGSNLKCARTDARPEPGDQLRGRRAHCSKGRFQHPARKAAPARVRCGDLIALPLTG